ncbi:helix-turn-helix transcriptional regulator [Lactobacillus agilis]|uniref:Helix-turn-helix transcriptional regulator n=1 Tax=Ligilactobacillus agilis TaxID=1601 RepID=A0A848C805_9LACO|nr:helix-turn-helix transcriptional regulator [Ligilactobacillus agilis]MDY4064512.1 helix-turn-helix transcriptional regulator [Ligilactobacillus agilis]NME42197.1 helix-turn-helix transcriptional regulator [Ligilactobacillus agilis]
MPKITIKAARVNAGLTQKEAAERLGIAYQTLSSYEKNNKSIRLEVLEKMCSLYGIPMEYIFLK